MSADRTAAASCSRLGLTLLELMLAMTFFSLLTAAAMNLIRLSYQSQQQWGVAIEPALEMERAMARLEQDIEAAQPFFGVPWVGSDHRLEFARVEMVPRDGGIPQPEWLRVVYQLESGEGGLVLTRQEWVWRRQGSDAQPLRQETLWHLASGTFAFGRKAGDEPLTWDVTWKDKRGRVPRFVKFDFALPAAGAPQPIEISRVLRNPAGITTPEESQ